MPRLSRWARNALTALSLLLCMATLVVWVAGYGVRMKARIATTVRAGGTAEYVCDAWDGTVGFEARSWAAPVGTVVVNDHALKPGAWAEVTPNGEPRWWISWTRGGFSFERFRGPGFVSLGFSFPCWALAPAAGALPIKRALRSRRRRRLRRRGRCVFCSYDLTGNVSGVCPECGRPVEQEAT